MGYKLTEHKCISGDEVSGNEKTAFIMQVFYPFKAKYQSIIKSENTVNSDPNAVK